MSSPFLVSAAQAALHSLVMGMQIATTCFQRGLGVDQIREGLPAYLPNVADDSPLAPAVLPLRSLVPSENGHDITPEFMARAFYESAVQLHHITRAEQPHISLLAEDMRHIWRRGLSHPPVASNAALALDLAEDDEQIVAWLRQFIEYSPQPMGVVRCRPDGSAEMVLFNKKNRERWGLNEQQVSRVDVLRFFYVEDHDMVRSFIRECLDSGSASRSGVRMLKRAGGHLLVDMYVGRVDATHYAYFQVIDETEREEAVQQVSIRDAVFRNAGKPLLMLSFDDDGMPSGMVTSAGFDRMMGYKPGEIGTKPVIDFIPKGLRPVFVERLREFLKTGSLKWQAVDLVRKDGSTVLVDIEANDSGVKDKRFAIVSFADAQARIAAERDAADAQSLAIVSQTSAHIAHDFNNLMTIISGGLQLLQMRNPDDDLLPAMLKNTDIMAGMMNGFRRTTDSVKDELDPHSILDPMMIKLIAPKVTGVDIALDLTDEPGMVAGPNHSVWQFVHNVIKNAMESMEGVEERRLTISTENVELLSEGALRRIDPDKRFPDARPGRFFMLSVQDTGSGIPPEALPRIFEDHFSTKDSSVVGRGRGLSATQKAIALRGGLLTIRSTVGRGTVFEIYLPLLRGTGIAPKQPGASAISSDILPDSRWVSPGNEVVLVADDEEPIRNQFAKVLKFYGYKDVLFAATTQETLRIVRERPEVTAVVMDWRMPGDTGDILIGDLRSIRPRLPILVNTGLVPDHKDLYAGVQFSPKLKGSSAIARAVRRLINGEPIDS